MKEAGYKASVYEPEIGKFRVPTLRNVDQRPSPNFVKAFGHNGYFKTLKEIVHFYNTRDVLPRCEKMSNPRPGEDCWPEPRFYRPEQGRTWEPRANRGRGNAIVIFLKTLTDGYKMGK